MNSSSSVTDVLLPRWSLWAWLLGAVIGLSLLIGIYGRQATDFEQVTLAKGTTAVYAEVSGQRIHCADDRDMQLCVQGARQRGATREVVWLGNSQLHAINQLRKGERSAAAQLFDRLKADGRDLLAFSQPNANLQEHAVVFAAALDQLKVEALLLPVVMDDTREDGVRETLRKMLHSPGVAARLSRYPAGATLLRLNKTSSEGAETGAIRKTLQERMEGAATTWLDEHATFWAARKEARGDVMLALYSLRNSVFRIRPDTVRRLIPSRYAANMAALELILAMANAERVPVRLYIAPIRQDAKLPYDAGQYAQFKSEVAALAQSYQGTLLNWEALVLPEFWGSKDATSLGGEVEIDYMHFRADGHALLAEAAYRALKSD